MNMDQSKQQFPTEASFRDFFETIMWPEGRVCPHCCGKKSYIISSKTARAGLYQCGKCNRQFSVTTKIPIHSTKLCLWKLLMYF